MMTDINKKPKKSVFSSKIYFFTDNLIDINEITSTLFERFSLKSKVYINNVNDNENVCFTIYMFLNLNLAAFNNVSSVLEEIIKTTTDKQTILFYKDLSSTKSSKSYEWKYSIKGVDINNKIAKISKVSFIPDDDD
jgi:hypothetical protein